MDIHGSTCISISLPPLSLSLSLSLSDWCLAHTSLAPPFHTPTLWSNQSPPSSLPIMIHLHQNYMSVTHVTPNIWRGVCVCVCVCVCVRVCVRVCCYNRHRVTEEPHPYTPNPGRRSSWVDVSWKVWMCVSVSEEPPTSGDTL